MNKVIDAAVAVRKAPTTSFQGQAWRCHCRWSRQRGCPASKSAHWQNVHGTPHCPGSAVVMVGSPHPEPSTPPDARVAQLAEMANGWTTDSISPSVMLECPVEPGSDLDTLWKSRTCSEVIVLSALEVRPSNMGGNWIRFGMNGVWTSCSGLCCASISRSTM